MGIPGMDTHSGIRDDFLNPVHGSVVAQYRFEALRANVVRASLRVNYKYLSTESTYYKSYARKATP
jgi:hypothetical protein